MHGSPLPSSRLSRARLLPWPERSCAVERSAFGASHDTPEGTRTHEVFGRKCRSAFARLGFLPFFPQLGRGRLRVSWRWRDRRRPRPWTRWPRPRASRCAGPRRARPAAQMPATSAAAASTMPSTSRMRDGRRRQARENRSGSQPADGHAPGSGLQRQRAQVRLYVDSGEVPAGERVPTQQVAGTERCQQRGHEQRERRGAERAGRRRKPAATGASWLPPTAPARGTANVAFAGALPSRPAKYRQHAITASSTTPAARRALRDERRGQREVGRTAHPGEV